MRAAVSLTSSVRVPSSYSSSLGRLAPKVFVSTASQPASRYPRWTPATTSGRVSESTSLQPCRPSKSRTVSSLASCIRCSVVPMAPSKTTTPLAIASRRFLSAIRGGAPYHAPRRSIVANPPRDGYPGEGSSHAQDRGRKQEVLVMVAAPLAGAQAGWRAIRGGGGRAGHAGHRRQHPQVLAVRPRSGADRRQSHHLGLARHLRVPERE